MDDNRVPLWVQRIKISYKGTIERPRTTWGSSSIYEHTRKTRKEWAEMQEDSL
jgi:hypothetical protein